MQVQRRLTQNREAARKSRMRKKVLKDNHLYEFLLISDIWFEDLLKFVLQVYVQQLETSRLKLAQLEQELERTKQKVRWNGGVRSHIGWRGERSISYMGVETSP